MCLAPTFLRGSQPLTRRCPLGGRCRFPPAAFEKFTAIFGFHACDGRGPGRGVSALSRFGPSGRKRVHVGAPPSPRIWGLLAAGRLLGPRAPFPRSGSDSRGPAAPWPSELRRLPFLFNHFPVGVSDRIIVIGVFSGSPIPSSAACGRLASPSGKFFHLFSDIVFLTSRNTMLRVDSFHSSVGILQLFAP